MLGVKKMSTNQRKDKNHNLENETKLVRIDKADHEWLKEKAYIDRLSIKEVVHVIIDNYKSKKE